MQQFRTGHSLRLQRDQVIRGGWRSNGKFGPQLNVSEEYFARYPVSKHKITKKTTIE